MLRTIHRYMVVGGLLSLIVAAAAGCGALDVSDPTAIQDDELNSGAGAQLLRNDALRLLYTAVGEGALFSGLFSDELISDPPAYYEQYGIISDRDILDRRKNLEYEQRFGSGGFSSWQEVRRAASIAMLKLAAYGTDAQVGEMFALRGYAEVRVAEDVCPGFPLHDVVNFAPVYGGPLSTDSVFQRAVADFDSALAHAADSARIMNLARVGQARALLGLGRFAEARAAASPVPTEYLTNAMTLPINSCDPMGNPLAMPEDVCGQLTIGVANGEGGNGLDFVAADDPRLGTDSMATANDGVTVLYTAAKYPNVSTPIVLTSGIEARLIEAEAALHEGDPSWITILNDLRASPDYPGLTPLTAPTTPDAQVDMVFRERAFWLFGTGHRLADLRRLVSRYGREKESVFPTGAYRLGGSYDAATSLPFAAAVESAFNPAVTGCTSR